MMTKEMVRLQRLAEQYEIARDCYHAAPDQGLAETMAKSRLPGGLLDMEGAMERLLPPEGVAVFAEPGAEVLVVCFDAEGDVQVVRVRLHGVEGEGI